MPRTDAHYYRDLLGRRFRGRKVILTGMLAAASGTVELLRELDAERPFLLAEGVGTGDLPSTRDLEWIMVGESSSNDLMQSIRAYERNLANPSPDVVAAVDRYDPERTAVVLRELTLGLQTAAARRVYGAKDPRWVALEDKTIIDALWDRLGVPRAPASIVRARQRELRAAARELDLGLGTVWAADASEGWHGGATGLRWIRGDGDARAQAPWFVERCQRVRVMPFLEGIPCSIHGMVFPDAVIAFRPVEQLTLRAPNESTLRYAGCATLWDPPKADREEMRELARRVGAALRSDVDFRGTFTIDGVMTAQGFRPTELNPRFGAGMATLVRALPELPFYLVDLAVCQGEPWDFRPPELEALVVTSADAIRTCRARAWDSAVYGETKRCVVARSADGEYRVAKEGEAVVATAMIGPSPMGCFFSLALEPDADLVGASAAPQAVRAFAFADRELGTSFGPLEAARSVR